MIELSKNEQSVLNAVVTLQQELDYSPSYREIRDASCVESISTVHRFLDKFEQGGLLSIGLEARPDPKGRKPNRSIRLNWERLTELGLRPPNSVPILGQITAGEPIQVDPKDLSKVEGWIKPPHGSREKISSLFALRVEGYSMKDASVLPGDIVILRPAKTAYKGEMVAVWIEEDDETTLKYFYQEGNQVRLQPANPDYQPIVRPASNVRIQGKVVAVIRNVN